MTEKYIICVDPESKHVYTLGLNSNTVVIEWNVPMSFRERARKSLKMLKDLTRDNTTYNWWFYSDAARHYQRRKFPKHLLKPDMTKYPVYLKLSKISLAFQDTTSIELLVDLTAYQQLTSEGQMRVQIPNNIMVHAKITTNPDEVIKKIVRQVYKEYKIKLRPMHEDHKFVLKISGYHEYLIGDHPLFNFERVRSNLRGVKNLPVVLEEIPKLILNENYPPLVERKIKDIMEGIIEPIDWEKFKEAPIIMWHPPVELPAFNEADEQPQKQNEGDDHSEERKLQSKVFRSEKNNEPLERPRAYVHFIMRDFLRERRRQREEELILYKNLQHFSGEIEFPFEVKIHGLEKMISIFKQYQQNATYNGFVTPGYITLQSQETHGGEHAPKKKEKKKKKDLVTIAPKFVKTKKDRPANDLDAKMHLATDNVSVQTNQGQGSNVFQSLVSTYGLPFVPYLISVEMGIYYRNDLLQPHLTRETTLKPFSFCPRWSESLDFQIPVSQIPLEAKLAFNVKAFSAIGETMIVASSAMSLFDAFGKMIQGYVVLNLWPFYRYEPRLLCMDEYWGVHGKLLVGKTEELRQTYRAEKFARLIIQLPTFSAPVYYSMRDETYLKAKGEAGYEITKEEEKSVEDEGLFSQLKNNLMKKMGFTKSNDRKRDDILKRIPGTEDLAKLQELIKRDPLEFVLEQKLDDNERETLIICRHHYKTIPSALPIFLTAIDWSDPNQMDEAHRMLKAWTPLSPEESLCLLDARFADEAVRAYAVERINTAQDDELALYMLQLTMALAYEPMHLSCLSEMLLERSLANPHTVGHEFYWLLKSQLHVKATFERYTLLLREFCMLCGSFREEIADEITMNGHFKEIAEAAAKESEKTRQNLVKEKLGKLRGSAVLPKKFCYSLDMRMRAAGIIAEECKVMDSKKAPIWVVCKNAQESCNEKLLMIFKVGDDLRQDLLTLQLIRIMDKIWLDNGLDFRMKPYRVVSTADQVGMIEVVGNSNTTAGIQKEYGGTFGSFKEKTLLEYIHKYNPDPQSKQNALDNFVRSCAGYCVATYLLGKK